MARAILVEGLSGTGKSTALRNLPPKQTLLITPNGKQLPFPGARKNYVPVDPATGQGNVFVTDQLNDIRGHLQWADKVTKFKYVVIDDLSHFFSARIMDPDFIAKSSGGAAFAKWNVFGSDVFNAMFATFPSLREDMTIIVNQHTSLDDMGQYTFKSPGKLLTNVIDPVSYFTYVIHSMLTKGDNGMKYQFIVNNDGVHEAKTPMGCMPEMYMDNDIFAVIQYIEKYENGE